MSTPETLVAATGTVWATGQLTPALQRRDRYVPESMAHPAKRAESVVNRWETRTESASLEQS